MKKSILDLYEKLLQQSLKVPLLVDLAEHRSGSFIDELQEWLRTTEKILEENRMPQCSELAGLRSKIVSAKYATNVPANKRRKHMTAVATEVLYAAQSTLLGVIEPMAHRIEEARESISQLLGVAYQTGMINAAMDFNDIVQGLWQTFSSHEQLKGLTSKILVSLNRSDALRILADEIELIQD